MQCEKKLRRKKTDPRQVNLLDFKTQRTCGAEMVDIGDFS